MEAISYRRVSTAEQGVSGLGLDAQRTAITAELERRGWHLAGDYDEVASGGRKARRPRLEAACDHARQIGGILIAAKLDRVSRDVIVFAQLLDRAAREKWAMLVLDIPMDTTTPAGRFTAITMANAAELERALIGERTQVTMAEAKRRGVRLGRTRETPPAILQRVVKQRDSGATWQSIADGLNTDAVPTTRGGTMWRVSTVQRVYTSAQLDAEAAQARVS